MTIPSYAVRKPVVMLLRPIVVYGVAAVVAFQHGYHWLAAIIIILYALGVASTPLSAAVTDTDISVRTLFRNSRYSLCDVTEVSAVEGIIPRIRVETRDASIKINGFSTAQLRNLRQAIETARDALNADLTNR